MSLLWYSDACYAKLNAVIETMNERHKCFVSEMRECGLLYGTDPSLFFPKLEVSLYDNYESSLPIEPDFMGDTLLTGLEKVIGLPWILYHLSIYPI